MKKKITVGFLTLETVLYLSFMILDLMGNSDHTIVLKYSGILLCLAFSIWSAVKGGDRLLPPALLLTAVADSFLLVLNRNYALGVLIFLGAQITYLLLLWRGTGKTLWPIRLLLPAATITIIAALNLLTPLNILVGLYFSQLVVNALAAWLMPGKKWRCFAIGLTLFVGCDLCVGIFNMRGVFPEGLYQFARVGMWLFYLPSQVLIALSGRACDKEKEIHENI